MNTGAILIVIGLSVVPLFALVFRQTLLLRMTAVLILAGSAMLYLFALLGPLPRAAMTMRAAHGQITQDYEDGVYALSGISRPMMPLIVVPILGLSMMAILGRKNKNG